MGMSIGLLAGIILHQNRLRLNDSLMTNIEALSKSDEDPCIRNSDSDCPGPCLYANVGKKKGKFYEVVHLSDSLDIRRTYSYEKCYANGHGIMEGSSMPLETKQDDSEFVKCEGERGHISFPFIDSI